MQGMQFSVLASGSKGNATYVEAGGMRLLIDAGLSCLSLERRMAAMGIDPTVLDGILITHEHSDHVKGLGRLARKYHVPVYANEGTAAVVERQCLYERLPVPEFVLFQSDCPFALGELTVTPIRISHDTAEPVAYTLDDGNDCLGYFTDLGVITQGVAEALPRCSALVLESNHDLQMLAASSRPYHLISRIRGNAGHLSNEQACEALARYASAELKALVLAHLSGECNTPDIAEAMMHHTIKALGRHELLARFCVAQQDAPLPFITL